MSTLIKKYRSNKLPKIILTALSFCLIVGAGMIYLSQKTDAFAPNYNPDNLIDDPTFLNNDSMSAADIQIFLSNIGSGLATYTDTESCDAATAMYYTHCGQTVSAAQIIYDAAQAYGINPRVIIGTLEKEQSLITDPAPSPSQLNCAMGYDSCHSYAGFYSQVDWGAWTFRYSYEGASGHATWDQWSPGANYICGTAKANFYSNGLYPGNTVTFADSGGTPETVTIANAATAALDCYTPYVGPYSLTGYSGSYNFVYFYQLWFGSTQASTPYAWAYESQSAYSDSAYTHQLEGVPTVAPGGDIYAQLTARNVGYQTWDQSTLHLGTSNPDDRTSIFYDSSWLNAERPTALLQSSISPGGDGTFNFILHAPQQTGTYREYFNLVADGISWLNDPGLYYQINVVSPFSAPNHSDTTMVPGQSIVPGQYIISPDTQTVLVLQKDGNLVLYEDFVPVWDSNTTGFPAARLLMQPDGNLVLYDKNNVALWDTETSANSGAWLNLQPDGNLVLYSSTNTPLWSTSTVHNPINLSYLNTTLPDSFMFAGQSLYTADRSHRLALQTDGNLVLYNSSGKALWDTATEGIPIEFLALQSDGNLVLYDVNGNPVWTTNTAGNPADTLTVQQDGNLVLYSSSDTPLWDSQTGGQ